MESDAKDERCWVTDGSLVCPEAKYTMSRVLKKRTGLLRIRALREEKSGHAQSYRSAAEASPEGELACNQAGLALGWTGTDEK